ncbi:MAG: OmpA family protein [Myxococcota bacterium]
MIGSLMGFVSLFRLVSLANELDFTYNPSLDSGDKPSFILIPSAGVKTIDVEIVAGGKSYQHSRTNLPSGQEIEFSWPRDPAVTEALATVRCVFQDGFVAEAQLPVEYSYGGLLSVDLSTAQADMENNLFKVSVSGAVESAEVITYGAKKAMIDRSRYNIQSGPGVIEIPWKGDKDEVVLIDVTLEGINAFAGFTYSPWYLDIPHQEVLFDSNSANIADSEYWKLESTLSDLKDTLDKYGSVVPVKLFIGGCTDTVGDQSHNQNLSMARARAIAQWLRAHGYTHPIFYYGFGENLLAVNTGDGVDEVKNRRAIYIVSSNPPPASSGIPNVRWKELP